MAAAVGARGAGGSLALNRRLVLGVVLAAAALLVGLRLFQPAEEGTAVLVARRDLAAGQVVRAEDLAVERMTLAGGLRELALGEEDRDAVVGRVLGRPVAAGELVTEAALGGEAALRPGEVALPLPVTPNRTFVPYDLAPGDEVAVYATGGAAGSYQTVLAVRRARVLTVVRQEDFRAVEETVTVPGTPSHVVLAVPAGDEVSRLAEAVAVNAVTLARIPPGDGAQQGGPQPGGARTPAGQEAAR